MGEWKVYFIKEDTKRGLTKIGYTNELSTRILHLQVGNPRRLKVAFALPCESKLQAQRLERFFHRQLYKRCHINGEWFDLNGVYLLPLIDKFNSSHKQMFESKIDFKNRDKSFEGKVSAKQEYEDKLKEIEEDVAKHLDLALLRWLNYLG